MLLPAGQRRYQKGAYMVRRKKEEYTHGLREKRHPILCPVCGRRIMDASWNTRTRLVTPTKGSYPDYYLKCGRCAAEIGVIKIE